MDDEEVQALCGEDIADAGVGAAVAEVNNNTTTTNTSVAVASPVDQVEKVIGLAERYFDRVDAAQLLELLPPTTPVASLLRYCKIVMEYGSAKKRNLQVKYLFNFLSEFFAGKHCIVLVSGHFTF